MKYGEGKGGWSTRVCRRAHGCGLWRSIRDGWENFSRHVSFVVGNGSRILFWHHKWTGDNSLKSLYPQLFKFSANKEAFVSEVLSSLASDNDRVWSLRFYREFNHWDSLLHFIQTRIPRGGGSDNLSWCLNGSGKFDVRSFYHKIRNAPLTSFPWKVKVPKRVAFFM